MVKIKQYGALPLNIEEICRYARCPAAEMPAYLKDCIAESEKAFSYAVCYDIYPVKQFDNEIDLGFAVVKSNDLQKNLYGCGQIILFAATAGIGIDLLIKKYSHISPSKAVLFQAIGSAAAEAVCEAFCKDMSAVTGELRPRYSPGYGDLSLTLQADIFRVLQPSRNIVVSLSDSYIMTPSKSVTAIVGIKKKRCQNERS